MMALLSLCCCSHVAIAVAATARANTVATATDVTDAAIAAVLPAVNAAPVSQKQVYSVDVYVGWQRWL
jgi:hypothetical protein